MRRMLNRLFWTCAHKENLVVRSVGVERTVCEKCGHLSFSIAPDFSAGVTSAYVEQPELSQASSL